MHKDRRNQMAVHHGAVRRKSIKINVYRRFKSVNGIRGASAGVLRDIKRT